MLRRLVAKSAGLAFAACVACVACTTSDLGSLTGADAGLSLGGAGGATGGRAGETGQNGGMSGAGGGASGHGGGSGEGGATDLPDASASGGASQGGMPDASRGGASDGDAGASLPNDGTALGKVGTACSVEGATACAGHAQQAKVVCTAGKWRANGSCTGGKNCDTTPGPSAGSCQPIAAGCAGQASGAAICQGIDRLACGADLVTTARLDTCPYVCTDGLCLGGCTPGTRQCNAFSPETCDPTGAWTDDSPCPHLCSGGACAGTCTPGATQCNGLVVQACDANGAWQDGAPCTSQACVGGACTGICTPGTKQCASNVVQTCDASGIWQDGAACASQACVAGACTGVCVPGATRCSENGVQTCGPNGQYGAAVPCNAQTCIAGACTGVCAPGTKGCSNLTTQTCDTTTGTWIDGAVCTSVCAGGTCSGTCVPGKKQCRGLVVQTCDGTGTWQDGTACVSSACTNGACVGLCTPGSKQCVSNGIETCSAAGQWGAPSLCVASACVNGACTGVCAPGATQCGSGGTGLQTCDTTGQYGAPVTCPSGICTSGACTPCYEQSLTVTNPAAAAAQTSFQVRLDITSSNASFWSHLAGGAAATGSDLRIRTAADVDLSYWIDQLDGAAKTARIWVKVPSIAAGPSTTALKLYYGNGARAAATSITSTMIFGDEFDGTGTGSVVPGLDGNRWSVEACLGFVGPCGAALAATGWSVSGGQLHMTSTSGRLQALAAAGGTVSSATQRVVTESRFRGTTFANGFSVNGVFTDNPTAFGLLVQPGNYFYYDGNNWSLPLGYAGGPFAEWTLSSIVFSSNNVGTVQRWSDGATSASLVGLAAYTPSGAPLTLGTRYDNSAVGQTVAGDWEWVLIRRYASPAPTLAAGNDETQVACSP